MRTCIAGLIGLALAPAALALPALALPALAQPASVQRGDYLVNRVMLCGDCHSPRGEHGEPVPGRELSGAPFKGAPAHPPPNFATYVPSIRGLPPGYAQADMARLMETGLKPNGSKPRPPMPPFRLDHPDAQAVAAYLAALKPPA